MNILASKLVDQWLKIVKNETVPEKELISIVPKNDIMVDVPTPVSDHIHEVTVNTTVIEPELDKSLEISPQTFYKVTVRDGKQVIHKVGEPVTEVEIKEEVVEEQVEIEKEKDKDSKKEIKKDDRDKSKDRKRESHSHDRSKHKNHSSSSKSSSHSHNSSKEKSGSNSKDKDKDRHKDRHRERERDKDKKHRDKDHRSNGTIKSSSNKEKDKEKQAEKDKATLAKIQPQSIDKLGKIPKKSSGEKSKDKKSDESSHKQKPSISIEVRKKGEGDRPKTVKVFNSKLRSTGLEEAPKPPPSRTAVKKPTATLPSVMPLKRPSPSREAPPPPEKKIKLPDHEEKQTKPGGIKLIPAKPKRKYFLFYDIYTNVKIVFQDKLKPVLRVYGVLKSLQ